MSALRPARTIFKKWLRYVFAVWLTITFIFAILAVVGGNPVSLFFDPRLSPETRARLETIYGYDRPLPVQYALYLGNALRGELGTSFLFKQPVSSILLSRMGQTLVLGGSGYLLGSLLCFLFLYVINQKRRPGLGKAIEELSSLMLVIPSFLFAALFISIFGVKLGWLPMFGASDLFEGGGGSWAALFASPRRAFLPALSLALPMAAHFTAYLQEQIRALDEEPYILSARGRGVSERRIFLNHKLRRILPGFVQLAGLYLPMIGGGALVIEAMFGWPGLGLVMMDAVLARDYPLLAGGCLWTSCLVILGYEFADFLRNMLQSREGTR